MAVDQKIIDSLVQQILATSDSSKWTGEGFGSAESNAKDMAKILAGIGITDIKQFGKVTQEIPTYDENGNQNGTQKVEGFGNKLTNQVVPNTYGERQSGNAFGGTYSGKGNTGYRVEFDANGNPVFFTTSASSSDVPKWVLPAITIGAGLFGVPSIIGSALAPSASAAIQAGLGGAVVGGGTAALTDQDILKGALTGGLLSYGANVVGDLINTPTTGPGYYDEITGKFIPDSNGLLQNPLTNTTSGTNLTSMSDYKYNQTTGEWTMPDGTVTKTLLTQNPVTSGKDILTNAGADVVNNTTLTTPTTTLTTPTTTPTPTPTTTLTDTLTKAGTGLLSGLTSQQIAGLISGGLGTVGGLMQQQTSREAAQAAQQRIDAETAAAKQAAQFRPVGMTTRFGTSSFKYDPVTGQMISAGYELTPEAKAQQDRLMALSNQGLTQAEQAQSLYAPLQTGAQSLFNLGNKYLAQTPEEVAQRYMTQQMNLLQPGRELELANLQNKLMQQGRSGLAVAQGGSYGATTPELQALFNARAAQEAKLAADAELAGQQQVTFGAGLLTKGAGAMGDYYGGQEKAYAPYTMASTKAQGLETLAQKPFTMSTDLGQMVTDAGVNAGNFGLKGAELSTKIATSDAATTNPYSTILAGLSDPNSTISQGIADYIKKNWG